jgi:hypothetical protein
MREGGRGNLTPDRDRRMWRRRERERRHRGRWRRHRGKWGRDEDASREVEEDTARPSGRTPPMGAQETESQFCGEERGVVWYVISIWIVRLNSFLVYSLIM